MHCLIAFVAIGVALTLYLPYRRHNRERAVAAKLEAIGGEAITRDSDILYPGEVVSVSLECSTAEKSDALLLNNFAQLELISIGQHQMKTDLLEALPRSARLVIVDAVVNEEIADCLLRLEFRRDIVFYQCKLSESSIAKLHNAYGERFVLR